jgi:WD40 repeat protein
MASVFISYSRKDQDFVRRLFDALKAAGRDAWVDWEGIPPTAEWLSEIYSAIDGADTFVFIVSPDSIASEVCGKEAAHALESRKRIIPIVCRPVGAAEVKAIEPLAPLVALNWIFTRAGDDFDKAFEQLRFALDTDLDYWHLSSDLLVRAKKWEEGARNSNLTLRGPELIAAERWLTAGADKEPHPTALQLDYITASRKATASRQRRLLTGVSIALIVTLILAVVSTVLFGQTRVQNAQLLSQNTQLRAQAIDGEANNEILQNHQDRGLLLAVEASHRLDGLTQRGALVTALESSPYLDSVLQSDLTSQGREFGNLVGLTLSAEGRVVFAATDDGELSVWTTQNWHLATHLYLVNARASTPAFLDGAALSPDGHTMAMREGSGLDLWDVATGARRAHLEDHNAIQDTNLIFNSQSLAFSPDGALLAAPECTDSICESVSIGLWDVQTNRFRGALPVQAPYGFYVTLAFSPDGTRLAISSGERVTLWDVRRATPLATFRPAAPTGDQDIYALAFSPDGATLAVSDRGQTAVPVGASVPGQVEFWDLRSGTTGAAPITQPGSIITALAFDPAGQEIFTATSGGVQTWDLATRTPIGPRLAGDTATIYSIAVTPDGRHIISGGSDGKVLAWRRTPYSDLGVPAIARAEHALLSGDGTRVVTWRNNEDALSIWNAATGSALVVLPHGAHGTPGEIAGVAFSRDGRILAVGSTDGHVTLWDATRAVATADIDLGDASASVSDLAFSPNGRYLIMASGGGAWMWDMATLSEVTDFHQAYANASRFGPVAISPDEQFAAIGVFDTALNENISLWSLRTHKIVRTIRAKDGTGPGRLEDFLVFGRDASQLATLDTTGVATIWDALTGKPSLQFRAILDTSFNQSYHTLAFRSDGRILVIGDGTTITLWDVATNAPYVRPIVDPNGFVELTTSADGRYLAEVQSNGSVAMRYITVEGWQAEACRVANRNLTQAEWKSLVSATEPYQKTCSDLPAGT